MVWIIIIMFFLNHHVLTSFLILWFNIVHINVWMLYCTFLRLIYMKSVNSKSYKKSKWELVHIQN